MGIFCSTIDSGAGLCIRSRTASQSTAQLVERCYLQRPDNEATAELLTDRYPLNGSLVK